MSNQHTIQVVKERFSPRGVKIAQNESLMWGTDQLKAIEFGNVMHEILSFVHTADDIDLAHWDYWPLSVIYFNLKLLELPLGERFRDRFENLFLKYKSSQTLLETFPEFGKTKRYRELQPLLKHITTSVYTCPSGKSVSV